MISAANLMVSPETALAHLILPDFGYYLRVAELANSPKFTPFCNDVFSTLSDQFPLRFKLFNTFNAFDGI
ncbi:MAG: hypothetical protein IPO48_00335 [Saprospiraceae bacterium]|nr:hypothetical protein [Saprospiraceae bacterium]